MSPEYDFRVLGVEEKGGMAPTDLKHRMSCKDLKTQRKKNIYNINVKQRGRNSNTVI